MKILIVEDDEDNIALFESELVRFSPVIARSRTSALTALNSGQFDVVVLDLRIPTVDRGLDSDVSHGLAVHSFVQEICLGTPVIVFSAYGTVKHATQLCENSERCDSWGCGLERPMTVYKEKTDFAECLDLLTSMAVHVEQLKEIELSTAGKPIGLTDSQKRVLRIFSRLQQGVNARVSSLGGGLSAAKTVRLEVQDEHGATRCLAVAKLGAIKDLRDEEGRYNHCIVPRLSVGVFAHQIKFVRSGAGNTGGIFYGFAKDYQQSLLDLLVSDPKQAALTVGHLRRLEADWQSNASYRQIVVGDLRRSLLSDESFQKISGQLNFDWQAVESLTVRMKWCCQHRDLHGLNVLVRDGEMPVLIDYGDVEPAPACLDPLILELSLLFHPAFKSVRGDWPKIDQALNWHDLGAFTRNTPLEPFIQSCREWAFAVQSGDKGVYATAYCYAVRQLKFPDTDKGLAISIATAARNAILAG